MSPTGPTVRHIGVVVPAHDEESLLPDCLSALSRSAERVGIGVSVVVVADACRDDTVGVVNRADTRAFASIDVVTIVANNVGVARDRGIRDLIARYGQDGLWVASTDADSTVPQRWFEEQLRHAQEGARAVVGTVDVRDWSEHSPRVMQRYLAQYHAIDGHRHAHGANLCMTAQAYVAAGGFPAVPYDEDVALVQRLVAGGEAVVWAGDIPVTTSSRVLGRAPRGFAGYLSRLATNDHLAQRTVSADAAT